MYTPHVTLSQVMRSPMFSPPLQYQYLSPCLQCNLFENSGISRDLALGHVYTTINGSFTMNYLRLIEVYEDQCQVDNLHWLYDAHRAVHLDLRCDVSHKTMCCAHACLFPDDRYTIYIRRSLLTKSASYS